MITPLHEQTLPDVARHYDDLDRFYRELWGEHVHHGLWLTGDETPEEAVVALTRLVCERAGVHAGQRVCDVGCGYGATARQLVRTCGAEVTAITLSAVQHAYAVRVDPSTHNPHYLLGDWLANTLPDASFDAVVAIESTEHMADKAACVAQMARVLRPGGRLVICAWLARDDATPAQVRWLLEPICREGRLPGMGSEAEYRALLAAAGLVVERAEEVSAQVRRTWPIVLRRLAAGILRHPSYRRYLMSASRRERVFAITVMRIWAAYAVGAMRYVILSARKAP